MGARVRRALAADGPEIGRVHADSWRVTYAGLLSTRYLAGLDEERLARGWRDRLGAPAPGDLALVGELDGQVAGFSLSRPCPGGADLVGFAGELQMLYVHPSAQRRGLGRALFEASCDALAGERLFWLVVWVVEANHAARAFYRRVGLRPDGARRNERLGGEPVSVIRYAGPLNPAIDYGRLGRAGRPR